MDFLFVDHISHQWNSYIAELERWSYFYSLLIANKVEPVFSFANTGTIKN